MRTFLENFHYFQATMIIALALACLVTVTAYSRTVCAGEGYECHCYGWVFYGYGSNWNSKYGGYSFGSLYFGGNTQCTNSEFGGDPSYGNSKYCVCASGTANVDRVEVCASEGGYCKCSGLVYYGARNKWVGKSGSQACNNGNFGDPIYGVRKSCVCLTY